MKKSKRSPSRIKYVQNNPTVSARLPVEKRTKLLSILNKLGISLRGLLIKMADELEIKAKSLDEARREGYQQGYEEAEKIYLVSYWCRVCGKPIVIKTPKEKEAAARYMTEHGWGHAECHKKRSPQK